MFRLQSTETSTLRVFFVAVSFALLTFTVTDAFASQEKFQVGDIVEVKFLGDTVQGEVTSFTGTGWPIVQFEHNGQTQEQLFPTSRVTLVEAADELKASEGDMAASSEMRIWTDSTGTFAVTAKLLSNKNGKIELEKKDGRVVTLPSIKLSNKDQAYLKELENQNSAENPFAGGEKKSNPGAGGRARSRGPRRATGASRSIPAITPEATSNEVVLSNNGWEIEPDAAAMVPSSEKIVNVKSGFTKHEFHNRSAGQSLSVNKRLLAVAKMNPFENNTEIVVADLETGTSKPPLMLGSEKATLLAISPDGTKAVTHEKGRGRDPGTMAFWSLGEEAKQTKAWNTASFFDRDGFAPKFAWFLDESRLLTVGRRVILWDCETAAALYSFAMKESTDPAISANAKQLAMVSGESVFIVGTSDGNAIGKIDPPSKAQVLAFSQDGLFLAGLSRGSGAIWVWDLDANELVRELSSPIVSAKTMKWVGDRYLLINDTDLIDIELRTTVWKYRPSGGSVMSINDGRFWFVGKSRLTPISLPHKNLDDQTAAFDPDDLLVLKPGAEVAIDLVLPFPPTEQKAIRDQLADRFKDNGVAIENGSDLKLVLKITKGKQQTQEVSSMMDPFGRRGSETIKYTPNVATATLTRDGITLWSQSRRFGPGGIIHMQNGESAQAAANRLCQPDAGFFKSIKMPKYISQFPNGKPLGESQITEQGIQ